jgi:hypothetical protein
MSELHPIATEEQRRALVRRNRELIAERGGWPDGALETCFALEEKFLGWAVYWSPGDVHDREPGYRASLKLHLGSRELFAPTPGELQVKLADDRGPSHFRPTGP